MLKQISLSIVVSLFFIASCQQIIGTIDSGTINLDKQESNKATETVENDRIHHDEMIGVLIWDEFYSEIDRTNYNQESKNNLLLAKTNGNKLITNQPKLILDVGPFAWTGDGQFIVGRCGGNKLCIFDASLIISENMDNSVGLGLQLPTKQFNLPGGCFTSTSEDAFQQNRLLSISVSQEHGQIAFVCGNGDHGSFQGLPCIMNSDGKYTCWNSDMVDRVFHLEWSPTGDQLLGSVEIDDQKIPLSSREQIYLFSSDGTNQRFIDYGSGGVWTADGNGILYFQKSIGNGKSKILKRNLFDDTVEVIYENPDDPSKYIYFDCHYLTYVCHMSLSPDGTKLLIVSPFALGPYRPQLISIDISTGNMRSYRDQQNIKWVYEAKWKP